jgi:hypothetical protein
MSRWARIAVLLLFASLCAVGVIRHPPGIAFADFRSPARLFAAVEERISAAKEQRFGVPIVPVALAADAADEPAGPITPHETHESIFARRIELGSIFAEGNQALVQVFFIGRDKRITPAVYRLAEDRGAWKVTSVRFADRWSEGEHLRGTEL